MNICSYCKRDLSSLNSFNAKTHIQNCTKKPKDSNQASLKSFFTKKTSEVEVSEDCESCDSSDSGFFQAAKRRKFNGVTEIHCLDEEDSGGFRHECESISPKCLGYKPLQDPFQNFPFQIFESEAYQIDFIFENGVLHSKSCWENDYKCTSNNGTNEACESLKYNQLLKKICDRSIDHKKHTNHVHLSYSALKRILDENREKEQEMHLETLNCRREIVSLRNKITLFKRMTNLIAMNDIPRLKQLVASAINNGSGVLGICEKINQAVTGQYKPKQFEEKDFALATLTLRIGGPRLLAAFSKMNLLPSQSTVTRSLAKTPKLQFSLALTEEDIIDRNLQNYFANAVGYYCMKIDEIAINPRIRWCATTNELIGVCQEHSKCISSKCCNILSILLYILNLFQLLF
jgi:hypothetical protein